MKKMDPPPTRMSEDGLEGKNPTKWHWEKGSWRWGLANIEALQKWFWDFYMFYKIMNALVWSFFDKIVNIFVDQSRWQALPFCRAMGYRQTIL